jgi:cytochrome c-type biogenesis protein CcmE
VADSPAVRRGAKLLIVLALVAAGATLAYAGAAPQAYKSVSEAAGDPSLVGQEVQVKASVVEGSVARNATPETFRIADGSRELLVRWNPAIPLPDQEAGGTVEGKNVVVAGTLMRDASTGQLYLQASSMSVGCASKYRPVSPSS